MGTASGKAAATAPDAESRAAVPVAVGLITRNRRDELLSTLDRLRALPERPGLVVVDNGSTDGTAAAIRAAHPDVVVIAAPVNLGAAGRNLAVRAAGTPYVAFADDDSWWAPGALRTAVEHLDARPSLGLLQARIAVGATGRTDPTCEAMAASPLPVAAGAVGPALLGFVACGVVVRSAAFLDVGGFRAPLGVGGEESLLAIDLAAAGWELSYVPDVLAHHHPSASRDPAARQRRVAVNELWTALQRRAPRAVLRQAGAVAALPGAWPEALRGAPWSLAHRRGISAELERRLQLL
jgi:N-acetylglucosaminyl-diphospho-decaprenol L-rhamnosyltransferase